MGCTDAAHLAAQLRSSHLPNPLLPLEDNTEVVCRAGAHPLTFIAVSWTWSSGACNWGT